MRFEPVDDERRRYAEVRRRSARPARGERAGVSARLDVEDVIYAKRHLR